MAGGLTEARIKERRKAASGRPGRRNFLDYGFTGGKNSCIRVPKKTAQKMRSKLKQLSRRGRGRKVGRFIDGTLHPVLRGWTNYFRPSQTKTFARESAVRHASPPVEIALALPLRMGA